MAVQDRKNFTAGKKGIAYLIMMNSRASLVTSISVGAMAGAIVIEPRTSVALLVVLAVLGACGWKKGLLPLPTGKTILKNYLENRVIWCLALLLVWCVISSNWALGGDGKLLRVLKLTALMGFGVLAFEARLGEIFSKNLANRSGISLGIAPGISPGIASGIIIGGVIGVAVIVVAILYAKLSGTSLWGSYYSDPLTTLNGNAVVLALFTWPVVMIVGKDAPVRRLIPFMVVLPILLVLPSGAALAALGLGAIVVAVRVYLGRAGGILMAAAAALMILSAPYVVKISGARHYETPIVVNDSKSIIPYSTRHRLAMWSFAAEKIDEKPWLGWGFGSSRYMPQEDHRLAPNMEIMPLHPHNLALQTRLELGLPGVMILATLVFLVFHRLATFTDDPWKSGFAMAPAVGWLFIANVSYGMWQSWWIATAFLLVILMRLAIADPADEGPKTAEIPAS